MMMKTGFLFLAACALGTSVSAAATSNPFAKDETVLRLDGLDLSTLEGQQRLAIRMDEAARTVCGDRLSSVHLALAERARECRAAVAADIRDQIEARTVVAANGSRTQFAYSR
nr:UrcA family protein [Altericroceibacterium xinjiangense]